MGRESVWIEKIPQANPNDNRGETWPLCIKGREFLTVCRRSQGSESCHVHQGRDRSKKIEMVFVAQGIVEFTFYNPETGEKGTYTAVPGDLVHICHGIVHKTVIMQDAVLLEPRFTAFDTQNPDTEKATIPE